jgi:outer membrane scaffolding protein for murein synthesis (MipA/OmpV family)
MTKPPALPYLISLLLAGACLPTLAQGSATMMMPDGSRDMYAGLALTASTAAAPGEQRPTVLRPLLQVQWSNGIFLSASGVAGWQLSERPGVEYGPLLLGSNDRDPHDSRRLAGSHPIRGTPDLGGFYSFYLNPQLRLQSRLSYDTSARGWSSGFELQQALPELAPHHSLSLSVGLGVNSGAVMRERFEVVGNGASAPRSYHPGGGVAGAGAAVNWNWQLGSSWLLHSSLSGNRLGSEAAGSPIVERRNSLTWSSGLAYRF